MNIRILKKDLKRKKSINLILLLFIFLSAMFIAGSLGNFFVVQNGLDEFMDVSGLADFLITTMGGSSQSVAEHDQKIEKFLTDQEQVEEFTWDDQLYLTKNQTKLHDGAHMEVNSSMILCSFALKGQKFFTEKNQEITAMKEGTIYMGRYLMQENGLQNGDKVTLYTENGYQKDFIILGGFKDVFLGSEMMGTERLLVCPDDFEEMLFQSGLPYGRTYSVNCKNLAEFETAYNNQGFHVIFSADRALVKSTYMMEMVIAVVILCVSICLIAIALVMLRFTIVFTVSEDYKEIGIMKAIGVKDRAIRKLYTIKYFVLAAAGSLFGFFASIPFSRLLLSQVTEKMVLSKNGCGFLFPFVICAAIMVLVTMCGYYSTRKIKKMTPMDAIRRGNNGERFHRKGRFSLRGSRQNATSFLACNDAACELRKYLALAVTGMLGVWLVVMPVNSINTLRSDGLLQWFSTQSCDFILVNDEKTAELIQAGKKQNYYEYMEKKRRFLREHGVAAEKLFTEVFFRMKIRKGDKSYQSLSFQGLNTRMEDYFYSEGTAPVYKNEIAITHIVAKKIGASIGDTVFITTDEEEEPYLVTALYQSMNNMGEGIRFTEEAELDYSTVSGGFGIQVRLEKQEKDLTQVIEKTRKLMPNDQVQSVREFIDHMVGGVSKRLDALKILIFSLVVAINILVVVLMQKIFLIREWGEIGMLKSVGFSNAAIIAWQAKRAMLVLFFGVAAGALTGNIISRFTAGKIFQLVGASRIEFVIKPIEVYVLYPLLLFAAGALACVLTVQRVRKGSVQEMNDLD